MPLLKFATQVPTKSHDLLLAGDAGTYQRLYTESGEEAGLPRFTPHQLRHDGASADALKEQTNLTLTSRGGWAFTKSVERYQALA